MADWADSLAVAAVATFVSAGGDVAYSVASVYWMAGPVSGFGVSLVSSVFTIPMVIIAWAIGHVAELRVLPRGAESTTAAVLGTLRRDRRLLAIFLLANLMQAVSVMMTIYSNSASRVAPIVQSLIPGLGPLAVIPFSKCILGDTKRYSAGRPLLAMALVIASTVLAVLPMFPGVASVQNDVDLDGGNAALQFAWASVFAGGLVPDALSGVLSQLVVLRLVAAPRVHARLRHPGHQQHGGGTGGGKGVGEEDAAVGAPLLHHELGLSARGAFRAACAFALCYSCLNAISMCVGVGACFWVDFVPFFGVSASFASFWASFSDTVRCSIGGSASGIAGCSDSMPAYMLLQCVGGTAGWLGSTVLVWQSAVFAEVAVVVGSAVQSLFWLIPGTAAVGMPLWSTVPSFVLSLAGSWFWKQWENDCGSVEDGEVFSAVSPAATPSGVPLVAPLVER